MPAPRVFSVWYYAPAIAVPSEYVEAVAKLQFCNSNLLKMHVLSDFSPQALA
jgi:hypothetical protein